MASFIKTQDHLTVVFDDGEIATIYPSNPNYSKIVKALNSKEWETVRALADPATEVKRAITDGGIADRVRIEGGIVYYDGNPLHNHLTDRMLEMLSEGIDVSPLAAFLQNLMENPSYRAVNELYTFLEASNLPITEDGHFLAYKRIREDWKDQWSGTKDNAIGTIVEMPRNEVDENKDRTCSSGLHFCSREYLPHYGANGGGRVVIVKINPRDVVAIPADYNNAKGRCSRYEVINEIKLSSNSYNAMPKAALEGSFRHSGTTSSGIDRELVQVNLETDTVVARFKTPSEAQKLTGIDASSISKVARGVRNTAGGYGWRYEDVASNVQANTQLTEDEHEQDDWWDSDDYDFWSPLDDLR
jgi:hypothetical protein